jgi:penicillin amidase
VDDSVIARTIRLVVAVLVLAAGLLVGARPIGSAPTLGPFLEPAHGVWALARTAAMPREGEARVPGLRDSVRVVYDERAVPHVFARSEEDAYRALGFVVARDRLFQLYVQTLASSGRLSELAGPVAIPLDREMRQLGLPRAAERALARLADTSAAVRVARAYADGVNAYVASMPASALPLEFRLLRTRPPVWEPLDTYYLQNRMGWTLAFISLERDRAAAAARVGIEAAKALFPDDSPIQEPIQPNGRGTPRFAFHPLPPPGKPDTASLLVAEALDAVLESPALAVAGGETGESERWMASNNWAVSPARSATGHALLAGDPHLDLTLPSLWYEAHLVVPGALDVYGATIPGAPAIVLGFNRDVAWTFTNTGADVMDVYVEQVDNEANPTRYRVDGRWRRLERRIESYRGKLGETIGVDTVLYTHRGPLQHVRGHWISLRWTALESGREGEAFLAGARARSAAAFEDAMAASYQAPAQNMLAADRGGHIAIRSTGRYPIRPGASGGGLPFDGTTSASDWTGDLPVAQWPQAFDPTQGFLASANQQPIDPATTSVWFGGSYDPWRALRINALLRADSAVTVDDMRRFQTDPGSARADYYVPFFVNAARRVAARGRSPAPAILGEAARVLARWDRRYTRDNTAAVLFESALREAAIETWDEFSTEGGARRVTPSSSVLAELMADSASAWWDVRGTAEIEDRDAILASSLAKAFIAARQRFGTPGDMGWRWSKTYRANIMHLLRLPALSATDLVVQGGPGTLSPLAGNGTNGPSWRMVVELGPTVHAWTTYPGGQSGNPLSARYRDRIPEWQAGALEAVHVPARPEELPPAQRSATLLLRPAR